MAGRDPQALVPISRFGVPSEAAPLVARLNELFSRVRQSLEQERRFTANAAHELRNPLAALRALVDVLPHPLPQGGTFRSFVLTTILLRLGEHESAANYAALAYQRDHAAMHAIHVARAAAALGHRAVALGWLRTGADVAGPDQHGHRMGGGVMGRVSLVDRQRRGRRYCAAHHPGEKRGSRAGESR